MPKMKKSFFPTIPYTFELLIRSPRRSYFFTLHFYLIQNSKYSISRLCLVYYHLKYLGITLDSRLNWLNKTRLAHKLCYYSSFAMSLRLWLMLGSLSKVLYWMYTNFIRPILLYISLSGTLSVKLLEFGKDTVNFKNWPAIIGACKSTPSATLGVILSFLPLQIVIETDAI